VKLDAHLHQISTLRMVELYVYSCTSFHDIMTNYLGPGIALRGVRGVRLFTHVSTRLNTAMIITSYE
jgi:hypothetical protein